MRSRAFVCATAIALVALALTTRPDALGRPGITPVPCPEQAWQLGDPKFEAMPGATAFFGQYDGGLYRVEIPDNWNGELTGLRFTEPLRPNDPGGLHITAPKP